ncbi:MAG TPA: hypothetical protein PLK08_06940, partial [Phycisphaerae bacterium]|nr:hypothetical protein [Phycisphaerae bacterium]
YDGREFRSAMGRQAEIHPECRQAATVAAPYRRKINNDYLTCSEIRRFYGIDERRMPFYVQIAIQTGSSGFSYFAGYT